MHYMADQHRDVFTGVTKLYWVPSYLAREDPQQSLLSPEELIKSLDTDTQVIAKPMELDQELEETIRHHIDNGQMVVCMSGGGGGSLDEWIRQKFGNKE